MKTQYVITVFRQEDNLPAKTELLPYTCVFDSKTEAETKFSHILTNALRHYDLPYFSEIFQRYREEIGTINNAAWLDSEWQPAFVNWLRENNITIYNRDKPFNLILSIENEITYLFSMTEASDNNPLIK